MAKFARDRFPPGFFDLPRDAGETLPVAVIDQWTHGDFKLSGVELAAYDV